MMRDLLILTLGAGMLVGCESNSAPQQGPAPAVAPINRSIRATADANHKRRTSNTNPGHGPGLNEMHAHLRRKAPARM